MKNENGNKKNVGPTVISGKSRVRAMSDTNRARAARGLPSAQIATRVFLDKKSAGVSLKSYLRAHAGPGAHSRKRARRAVNLWAAEVMCKFAPHGGFFLPVRRGLRRRDPSAASAAIDTTTDTTIGTDDPDRARFLQTLAKALVSP